MVAGFILLHIIFSSLAAMVLGMLGGYISIPVAVLSLLVGAFFARKYSFYITPYFSFKYGQLKFFEKCFFLFLLWAFYRLFAYLFYARTGSFMTLLPNNLGDLPFHISQIRSFVFGPIPFKNPSFSDEYFRYPFGVNLYSSLFESLGIPTGTHLFIIGIICSIVLLVVLYQISGWVGWACLLLGSGFSGWSIFQTGLWLDYQKDLLWKNPLLTLWVPQRGFLVGLPLGVLLLNFFNQAFWNPNSKSLNQYKLMGFLWGVLPFFHTHSFVFISFMLFLFALFYRNWSVFFRALKFAFFPAAIWVLFATNLFSGASVIHVGRFWTENHQSMLSTWFYNLGPSLLLFLIVFYHLVREKESYPIRQFLIFAGLFIFFQYFIFSRWSWDNIKFLIWPIIGWSMIAWKYYIVSLRPIFQIVLCIFISFTGFLTVVSRINGQNSSVELLSRFDFFNAKEITQDVDRNSSILALPTYNHPISFLGFKLIMGYDGHLWSHGIRFEEVEKDIYRIFLGEGDWMSLLKKYNVDYIYWGPLEREKFGDDQKPWMDSLSVLAEVNDVVMYKVSH